MIDHSAVITNSNYLRYKALANYFSKLEEKLPELEQYVPEGWEPFMTHDNGSKWTYIIREKKYPRDTLTLHVDLQPKTTNITVIHTVDILIRTLRHKLKTLQQVKSNPQISDLTSDNFNVRLLAAKELKRSKGE